MAKQKGKEKLVVVTDDPDNCACPQCGEEEDIARYCWGCMLHYCNTCATLFDVRKKQPEKKTGPTLEEEMRAWRDKEPKKKRRSRKRKGR